MRRLKYIFAMVALSFTLSCNSFLDIHPTGEKIESDLFSKAQGFEDALYGVYSALYGDGMYGVNTSFYINDILGQYFNKYTSSSTHIANKFAAFDYNDSDVRPKLDNIWDGYYRVISNVNNVIKNLDERDEAKGYPLYNIYYAESLALRAFLHFELTRYYSENILINPESEGIPYRTKYDFAVTPFEPLKTTYQHIISDFEEALKYYDGKEYYEESSLSTPFISNRVIHFNMHAVWAMMARVYWTMGDLENGAKYAKMVIESGRYSVVPNEELATFMAGTISKDETLWGVFSDTFNENVKSHLYLTNDYEKSLDVKQPYSLIYSTDKLSTDADYRLERWIVSIQDSEEGVNGPRCMKIYNTDIDLSEEIKGINMIRIPELYYIISEYYMEQGNQAEARKYLDEVIVKRGLTSYTVQNKDVTIDILNNERRKEYIAEGQYLFVLKKYHKDIQDMMTGRKYLADDGIYQFPLPSSETDYRN